jgi:hypothetical protein
MGYIHWGTHHMHLRIFYNEDWLLKRKSTFVLMNIFTIKKTQICYGIRLLHKKLFQGLTQSNNMKLLKKNDLKALPTTLYIVERRNESFKKKSSTSIKHSHSSTTSH